MSKFFFLCQPLYWLVTLLLKTAWKLTQEKKRYIIQGVVRKKYKPASASLSVTRNFWKAHYR